MSFITDLERDPQLAALAKFGLYVVSGLAGTLPLLFILWLAG